MFFRLTNSPTTFQTMMNTIFHDLIDEGNITIYMDNIAIHMGPRLGESNKEHLKRHRELVQCILKWLKRNNLHLNLKKCVFKQDHLNFLGVCVGGGSVQMEESKVNQVRNWIHPQNVHKVHKFLSFTSYYRYFIQGYSQIARPLLNLTKQEAFKSLRDKMVSKLVLWQPDFNKTFYLQTDTSKYRVGAVLSQDSKTKRVTPRK